MTAFESAWTFLKNAPVPNYAQPKTESSRTALGNRRGKDDYNQREMGRGVHPLQHTMTGTPYGTAVRMPRPENGSGESSFDSESMNTGTSLFNPAPSWQNMGDSANMYNALSSKKNSMQRGLANPEMGDSDDEYDEDDFLWVANTPQQPSTTMGATGSPAGVQQQPNDRTGRYPQFY